MALSWLKSVAHLYRSTGMTKLGPGENWRESALVSARSKSCSHVLLTDTNSFLMENSLQKLMNLKEVVVVPLLNGPFGHNSNLDGLMGENFIERKEIGTYRVCLTVVQKAG